MSLFTLRFVQIFSVLGIFGLSQFAGAFDVNYKQHRIREDYVRETVRESLHAELVNLDVGGGLLVVTAPGKVYGLGTIQCTLLPTRDGRQHVAKGCVSSIGWKKMGKALEGTTFRILRGHQGEMIYSEFEIYRAARAYLHDLRLKNVKVIPAPKPIAYLRRATVEGFDSWSQCSLEFKGEHLEIDPCWTEPRLPHASN